MPEDFKELDSGGLIDCMDGKLPIYSYYTITNAKRDVKISIGGFHSIKTPNGMNPETWIPLYNNNYLKWAKYHADTNICSAIFDDDSLAKQSFNADHSGSFCKGNYKDRDPLFKNVKVIYMAKDGSGYVALFYIYTDKRKGDIDEIIKQTSNMIKFK